MEEMEKRSRRRTRDLVTQAASQGLSENAIGCARISMMARSTNAPCKGRIQMRKTNPLHFFTFGLQRTAGPYRWVKRRNARCEQMFSALLPKADSRQTSLVVRFVPGTDTGMAVFSMLCQYLGRTIFPQISHQFAGMRRGRSKASHAQRQVTHDPTVGQWNYAE